MNNETIANTLAGQKEKITKQELKERIEAKLITRGIFNAQKATADQLYQASFLALKDIMLEYREAFKKRTKATNGKKVCYLCMEFLVGRFLKNDLSFAIRHSSAATKDSRAHFPMLLPFSGSTVHLQDLTRVSLSISSSSAVTQQFLSAMQVFTSVLSI